MPVEWCFELLQLAYKTSLFLAGRRTISFTSSLDYNQRYPTGSSGEMKKMREFPVDAKLVETLVSLRRLVLSSNLVMSRDSLCPPSTRMDRYALTRRQD